MSEPGVLNILVVTHYFWPEQFRISDLVWELSARGHAVSVLTGMPNYPGGTLFDGYRWWRRWREKSHGVVIHRTPIFLRRRARGWQLALNYFSFAISGSLLGPWYFRRRSFDVIFVYVPSPFTVGIPAIVMRRLKKAPMLFWVQDLWPESLAAAGAVQSRMVLNLVGKMVRMIYRRCDRVLVQSEAFVEPAVAAGAERSHTHYYPNWAEAFYRPLPPTSLKVGGRQVPAGFRVMFAGNLGEAQSLETIIGAAALLKTEKQIHWVILGDGRRRTWMEREVMRLNIGSNFHFLGIHAGERMPSFFAAADAMLVTLKADPVFAQTIPSKVQSYMSCGRPIVAALNGEGARVIADAEAGLVAGADNIAGLADAVVALYKMPLQEREQLGRNGRAYYEQHFDRDMLIRRLELWMQQLTEDGLCAS